MLVSASSYKRIVIKIGSALLVDKTRGLKREWLNSLCADVHMLREAFYWHVLIVKRSVNMNIKRGKCC